MKLYIFDFGWKHENWKPIFQSPKLSGFSINRGHFKSARPRSISRPITRTKNSPGTHGHEWSRHYGLSGRRRLILTDNIQVNNRGWSRAHIFVRRGHPYFVKLFYDWNVFLNRWPVKISDLESPRIKWPKSLSEEILKYWRNELSLDNMIVKGPLFSRSERILRLKRVYS